METNQLSIFVGDTPQRATAIRQIQHFVNKCGEAADMRVADFYAQASFGAASMACQLGLIDVSELSSINELCSANVALHNARQLGEAKAGA